VITLDVDGIDSVLAVTSLAQSACKELADVRLDARE
jgi:hypothetical protein